MEEDEGVENDYHSSPSALLPGARGGQAPLSVAPGLGPSGKRGGGEDGATLRPSAGGRVTTTTTTGLKGSSQQSLLGVFDEGLSEGGTLGRRREQVRWWLG